MLRILNVTLSRCTVPAQLMRVPFPPMETPRVLGVDDFALYGGAYGTLLVDAAARLPLTLREGPDAEQLGLWLREPPGVEVACRDGSLPTGWESLPATRHRAGQRPLSPAEPLPPRPGHCPCPPRLPARSTATGQGNRSRTNQEHCGGHPGRAPRPQAVRDRA
ncbi:hypothetical protein GCM10010433_27870 [Streptomyces pulveraceus]